MSTHDTENERAQSGHQAIIDDSWLRAREYIRRAEAVDVDPQRVLWPPANGRLSEKHELALAAHSATIQFRDDISAYRDLSAAFDVESKWKAEIDEIVIDGERHAISLQSMGQWAHQRITDESVEHDPIRGKVTRGKEFRVLLPVATCRLTYRHIQDILQELGFTAETADRTPEGEASPEDLVGLLTERGQQEAKGQLPERFTAGRGDE